MGFFRTKSIPAIDAGRLTSFQRKFLNHCIIEEFTADATLVLGQVVKLDVTEIDAAVASVTGLDSDAKANAVLGLIPKVIPTAAVAAGDPMAFGIVVEVGGASAGEKVLVVTKGVVCQALISAANVADGDALVAADAATTTAGTLETYAAGTHTAAKPFCKAYSTETDTSGYVMVTID